MEELRGDADCVFATMGKVEVGFVLPLPLR